MCGLGSLIGLLYTSMRPINSQKKPVCFVFAMGIEAWPFLGRVEVKRRWKRGKAVFREVFLEGRTALVVRCGVGPKRAAAAIRNLDAEPAAILSVGTAGGLVPELKVRDLIVASETVSGDAAEHALIWPDPLTAAAAESCRREGLPYRIGRLATVTRPVFDLSARQRLHAATGAEAVDMESHTMGECALKLGVPFTSVRVISDAVDSPPLPDPTNLKSLRRSPLKAPRKMMEMLRWYLFLRDFKRSIVLLPSVLVRFMRDHVQPG